MFEVLDTVVDTGQKVLCADISHALAVYTAPDGPISKGSPDGNIAPGLQVSHHRTVIVLTIVEVVVVEL